MATKQIALGTVIAVDTAGGSSYTTITLAMDATPPPRTRAGIEQAALTDTLDTEAPGIEEKSEYVFTQYWHPGDTQHQSIDTAFDAKSTCSWKLTYPFSVTVADTFSGWVKKLEPSTLQVNGMITRKVTVSRTSAITRT